MGVPPMTSHLVTFISEDSDALKGKWNEQAAGFNAVVSSLERDTPRFTLHIDAKAVLYVVKLPFLGQSLELKWVSESRKQSITLRPSFRCRQYQ